MNRFSSSNQIGGSDGGEIGISGWAKGGVSVYGLGRFPVTLYYEQWTKLLAVAARAASVPRRKQKQIEDEGINRIGPGKHPMAGTQKLETTPAPIRPEDLLTPQELADRLKVSKVGVRANARKDKAPQQEQAALPCIRMGKYLRFSWIAVSEWLIQNKD